jgi:UDP-N-acetylglucosamine 1-carboxyvinyltransferase
MGADIRTFGRTALVTGKRLHGARVQSTDLRGGAALVIAALAAEGESIVEHIHHIDRGYAHLAEKLSAAGGQITRAEG